MAGTAPWCATQVRDDGLRPAFTPSSGVGEGTGTGKTVEEILAEDAARSAYMEELGMGKESQMGSPWAKGDVLQVRTGAEAAENTVAVSEALHGEMQCGYGAFPRRKMSRYGLSAAVPLARR